MIKTCIKAGQSNFLAKGKESRPAMGCFIQYQSYLPINKKTNKVSVIDNLYRGT